MSVSSCCQNLVCCYRTCCTACINNDEIMTGQLFCILSKYTSRKVSVSACTCRNYNGNGTGWLPCGTTAADFCFCFFRRCCVRFCLCCRSCGGLRTAASALVSPSAAASVLSAAGAAVVSAGLLPPHAARLNTMVPAIAAAKSFFFIIIRSPSFRVFATLFFPYIYPRPLRTGHIPY